jgi:hypothetical protein
MTEGFDIDLLDTLDQKLVQSMDITYQNGKGNKLVPCLGPKITRLYLQTLKDPRSMSQGGIQLNACAFWLRLIIPN